jgi:hypothetical protein
MVFGCGYIEQAKTPNGKGRAEGKYHDVATVRHPAHAEATGSCTADIPGRYIHVFPTLSRTTELPVVEHAMVQ